MASPLQVAFPDVGVLVLGRRYQTDPHGENLPVELARAAVISYGLTSVEPGVELPGVVLARDRPPAMKPSLGIRVSLRSGVVEWTPASAQSSKRPGFPAWAPYRWLMDRERTTAYQQANAELRELRAVGQLLNNEFELLSYAVEDLLFCTDEPEAERLRAQARAQLDKLVADDRWVSETADRVWSQIEDCGPRALVAA